MTHFVFEDFSCFEIVIFPVSGLLLLVPTQHARFREFQIFCQMTIFFTIRKKVYFANFEFPIAHFFFLPIIKKVSLVIFPILLPDLEKSVGSQFANIGLNWVTIGSVDFAL